MTWTKRQVVEQAYEALGYAFYDFDLTPEQMQSGLRQLDAMVATWGGQGIHLGFPLPSSQATATLDESAGVPDWAVEALYLNLAVRIGPGIGKVPSPELRGSATSARKAMYARTVVPVQSRRDRYAAPLGAGNKPWRYDRGPFLLPDEETIDAGPDGPIDLE